ncbi:PaaX family transcriptional regulator [Pseudonocardia sediminis]|uniref:PaaX family transcriptional regulator n=1 Tax=Pseudonocardia sediminis TaxID=1397368 RepID=A0A4Q7V392_PSEST|nr:PaaX family transcriptional regulator C-terminal domain-containing protein [Pseudonocardia sediminis]RZT87964.1 PaaX family transcriptional regulator [Pseudonocardia sediminis]
MSESVGPTAGSSRPRRSPTSGLVATLFQLSGRSELPGVALVALLGEFGLSTAAARRHLARMRDDGQLAGVRSGRGTTYRMAGPFGRRVVQLGEEIGTGPPVWEGHFHALLFAVPESRRPYRDRLRRVASLVGYGQLQAGVLISVGDRSAQIAEVLAECPDDARVTRATISLDTAEAARVAIPAWDLDDVAATLAGHADTLESVLAEDTAPAADGATMRRFGELFNAVFIDLVRDPRLPEELRPPDWPYHRLLVAMDEVRHRFGPPAVEFLQTRLEELDR